MVTGCVISLYQEEWNIVYQCVYCFFIVVTPLFLSGLYVCGALLVMVVLFGLVTSRNLLYLE